MDFGGFLKSGFNTDYLFAPSGSYQTTEDVNAHQTELVMAQHQAGLLTDIETNAKIAELEQNTLGTVAAETGRPTDVFVSEATKNAENLQPTIRKTLGDLLEFPLSIIPPIGWILIFVGLLVYIEWVTGIFSGMLKKKVAS